ncbi:MAG: hypothetical protein ACRD1Q_18055 [Vicinamibacterales bacterium]
MRVLMAVVCGMGVLLQAAPGAAQDQVRVHIDAALQTATSNFTATAVFTEFVEEGQVTTNHTVGSGLVFGGGATVRAWRQLAVGAAVSFFSKNGTGQLEAELPHPFLFNQHRLVSAEASDLKRREIATHIIAGWIVPADRMEVTVSGGPSIYQVQQDLVSGITYTHEFPYDVAVFTGAITRRLEKVVVGFHVSGDVTWKLNNDVGLAVSGRYSRATVNDDETGTSIDVGGLQIGGGVRFFF